MNRIVNQSNDFLWFGYIVLVIISFLTLKKVSKVEEQKKKLKERIAEERNHYRV